MLYLWDFIGPFPPSQEILLYQHDPRIPMYEGTIGKLKYVICKHMCVYLAEFSMGQLMIRVRYSG